MAQSVVSICNRSLLQMGSRVQVSSVNPSDGTPAGDACSTLFQPTYETLARAAYWNCFRKQATLTLLKAAPGTPENVSGTTYPYPPAPWLYSYQYPPDCLMERFLLPPPCYASQGSPEPIFTNNGWANPSYPSVAIQFAVAYDTDATGNPNRVILTNLSKAIAVYTVNQPNPSAWDPQFQEAMVASLAVWLCPALSGNAQMMQMSIGIADRIVAEARRRDGDEGLTIVDPVADWVSVRGTPWAISQNPFITPYQGIAWPSYSGF